MKMVKVTGLVSESARTAVNAIASKEHTTALAWVADAVCRKLEAREAVPCDGILDGLNEEDQGRVRWYAETLRHARDDEEFRAAIDANFKYLEGVRRRLIGGLFDGT